MLDSPFTQAENDKDITRLNDEAVDVEDADDDDAVAKIDEELARATKRGAIIKQRLAAVYLGVLDPEIMPKVDLARKDFPELNDKNFEMFEFVFKKAQATPGFYEDCQARLHVFVAPDAASNPEAGSHLRVPPCYE